MVNTKCPKMINVKYFVCWLFHDILIRGYKIKMGYIDQLKYAILLIYVP